MRRVVSMLAALTALSLVGTGAVMAATPAGTSDGVVLLFEGILTADQVATGSDSTATGSATVRIDTNTQGVTVDMSWSGLSGPADWSHIHSGAPGTPRDDYFFEEVIDGDGPARTVDCVAWSVYPLCAPPTGSNHHEFSSPILNSEKTECLTFQCFVDFAIPQGFFLDIHTELYVGGEIRGQLVFAGWQPDARVRGGTTAAFLGEDRYNADARKQRVTLMGVRGKTLIYQVSLQNDAVHQGDSIKLVVTGASPTGYTVKYFIGTTEITGAVVGGTYQTRSLRPGAEVLITIKITVKATAAVGSSLTRTLTAISNADSTRTDTVRVVAKRA